MSVLEGLSICCTAIGSEQERAELERMIQELGGCLCELKGKPHVFVASSVQCTEYKSAKASPTAVPIVRPTWVRACHSAGRKVPLSGHELGPFDGLTISTSGHNAAEKESLGKLIQQGRGAYSKNMTKACTHLVIKTCEGFRTVSEKERHAHLWGTILVVWDSWLLQTAQNGAYSANEELFLVPQTEPAQDKALLRQPAQQMMPDPVAEPGSDTAKCLQAVPKIAPKQPQQSGTLVAGTSTAAASRETDQHARMSGPSGQPTDPQAHASKIGLQQETLAYPAAPATTSWMPSRQAPGEPANMSGPRPASAGYTAQPSTSMQHAHSEGDAFSSGRSPEPAHTLSGARQPFMAGPPSETFSFLDGLRVFLACCANSEIMELACVCREGGACRYPYLNPLITHIVVGSDIMADELQCIRQHQHKHGALVRVLDAGWLRQCGASRAHEDEEAWLFNPASALAAGPWRSREGSDLMDNREGSRAGFQAASSCEGNAPRHARPQAASGRGPLRDCWFSLAALEQDPAEKARMHELIRQAGGRIFDAKRINLVASTSSTYAVCPLGFPPPRLAEAMRQPDFKMVPEANRITPYWVELSIDCGAPVKQLGRDRVTCKPLPYQLPMPGMANVKLCASGMPDSAKNAIKELVKHLGGKYTQQMSRNNTHLIIRKAIGDKWRHATAFGVTAVTPDWLVDSALAGVLLPERTFEPPLPAPGEEDLNEATQFPFDMTKRPAATQHKQQVASASTMVGAGRDGQNDSSTGPSRASTAAEQSSGPRKDETLLQRMMSHTSASDQGLRGSMLEAAPGTNAGTQRCSAASRHRLQEAPPTFNDVDKSAACDPLAAMLDAGSRAGPEPPAEDGVVGAGLPSAGRGKHKSRLRNMQPMSCQEPSDDQEKNSQPGDAGNKASEWAVAAARLGNFLEAVPAPNLAGSQQDGLAHPAQRASSAGSGRQGASVGQLPGGLSSVPGDASAGEAMSMHSGDSTGLSHGASNLRKRGRAGAAGGPASSGGASKRPARATSAAPADAHAPAHLDCSQQVGYGGAGRVPPAVTTRRRAAQNAKSSLGGDGRGSEELAKQRLTRAVRSSVRKDVGKNEDALKAMGLMD